LISNFRRVRNVVRYLLGNSPASELYIEFSRQFFLNARISSFMKIHPMGTELCHADGHDVPNYNLQVRHPSCVQ